MKALDPRSFEEQELDSHRRRHAAGAEMTESKTPLTDKEERWAEWNGDEFKAVHVEFARALERHCEALHAVIRRTAANSLDAEAYESWKREQLGSKG